MKKTLGFFGVTTLAALFALAACNNAGSLAKKMDGDWSGTPTRFAKKTMVDGSYTPLLRFEQSGTQAGGSVELSAQLSVTMPVNAPIDSAGTTAVSATAAGIATVRGSWIAVDDDEVDLTFDMSTLTVDMDPEVEFELANIWASTDVPTARTVSDAVHKAFVKEMTLGITSAIQRMHEIDDIRIKDNLMQCEFGDSHVTFNRIYE